MPEILLNIPKVDARFQKMGCVTVPEVANRDLLVNAGCFHGILESDLNAGNGNGIIGCGHEIVGAPSRRGEYPYRIAMHSVEGSEDFKGAFW